MFELSFKDNMITRVDSKSTYPLKADNYGSIIFSVNQGFVIFKFSIKLNYTKDNPLLITIDDTPINVSGELSTHSYPGVMLKLNLDLCLQARNAIMRIVENDIISLDISTPFSITSPLYKQNGSNWITLTDKENEYVINYLSSINPKYLFLDGGINLNLINLKICE